MSTAAWIALNADKVAAYKVRYREQNREKVRASSRAYEARNREKVRLAKLLDKRSNPARERAQTDKWQEANPEKVKASMDKWRAANTHVGRASKAARRALSKPPAWADKGIISDIYKLARIYREAGLSATVDHIVPLRSRLVCGLHTDSNLTAIPMLDNISKGNRVWEGMPNG